MKLNKLKRGIAAVMTAAICLSAIPAQFGITAAAADDSYKITVATNGNGTAAADLTVQTIGGQVTLTATPAQGYQFDHWEIASSDAGQGNSSYSKTANVVFVLDTTASMDDEIEQVKDNLITLVQSLDAKDIGLNMSIIAYSDIKHIKNSTVYYTFANGTHWTTDVNEAVTIFGSIKTGSGYSETPTDAFSQLVTSDGSLNFPSGSPNNYIFLLTDEGYSELNDSSKNQYPMATWIDKFVAANVKTSVITTEYEYKRETYKDLYEKTGGIYIDIDSEDYSKLMQDFSDYLDQTAVGYSETSFSNPAKFNMPKCNIIATAYFKPVPKNTYKSTYSIKTITNDHGKAYASKSTAYAGESIKITATPDKGYVLDSIKCTKGGAVLSDDTFVMPESDVVIFVSFKEDTSEYLLTAHPYSYVFSYDTEMNLIETNSNRDFSSYPEYVSIKIDLGSDYAGRTGRICAGRKSDSNVIKTVTLDENGCYVFKAGIKKNYSFVLDD